MHSIQHSTKNKQPIYAGSRVVGKVIDGAFCKVISGSKHFLRKPKSICLSVASLESAEEAKAVEIRITDQETGLIYSASISHFRRYAFDIQRGGYEKQLALPLEYWDVSGGKVARQVTKNDETFSHIAQNAKPLQLSFGFKRNLPR